jgi:integrase
MAKWAGIVQERTTGSSVASLVDRYILEVIPHKAPRTQKDNLVEIRWLRAFFGQMPIDQVETSHVAQYIAHRKATTRANREIALLSHIYNKAILWGLTKHNPCSVPGLRNKEKPRSRYVEDAELEKFKELCPDWIKAYIDIKVLTGQRQRDLLDLEWSDIDEQGITVWVSKTKKRVKIALTDELQALLKNLPRSSKTIFATQQGEKYSSAGFSSIWRRLMAKYRLTGNEGFTEHDLRGKTATDMDDPIQAQRLLGHSSVKMTEMYIKQRKTDVVEPLRRKK